MGGPWEKFAPAQAAAPAPEAGAVGPWTKFQAPESRGAPAQRGPTMYAEPIGPGPSTRDRPLGENLRAMIPMGRDADAYPRGTYPEAADGQVYHAPAMVGDTRSVWDVAMGKPEAPGAIQRGPVTGSPALVLPGGAIPKLTKAAVTLAEGKGVGYLAGRTALSTAQGGAMALADGVDGESWQDKVDRAKSGAKLSGGIQIAAESIPVVGKALGAVARKIGAAVSGVDEKIIANYASRTDEVNALIKESGGDVTAAADTVRRELSEGIQRTKSQINAKISAALEKAAPEANISVKPLIDKLEAAKARLNPNFKSGAIAEIDEMLAAIKSEAKDGNVNVSSLYQIKQFLNEGAATAYNKGGQIFTRAGEAARAARDAAGDAREMLKPVAGAISEADGQLARLHRVERGLNKNMLAEGKPDAALIAAGSGAHARNAANLRALEQVSGVPVTQRARDLATAKEFASPAILPRDYTGKAVARQAGAALLGTAVGGPVGGMIGGALASPAAVKLGVNAMRVGKDVAARVPGANVPKFVRENPATATAATQLAAGQIRRANAPDDPAPVEAEPMMLPAAPKTGPERWARTGLERLGIADQALASKLLESKEGKRLLIEASDLPKGSKRLARIKEQIERMTDALSTRAATQVPSVRHERRPARGR